MDTVRGPQFILQKQKVLIIEDDPLLQQMYLAELHNFLEVLIAGTVAEGQVLFNKYAAEIAVITIDACVPMHKGACGRTEPTTYGLTAHIRKNFPGPMIAASSEEAFRQKLIKHGCGYHCTIKEQLPELILEFFGGETQPIPRPIIDFPII